MGGAGYWARLVIKLAAIAGYAYLGIQHGIFSRKTWNAARDALVMYRIEAPVLTGGRKVATVDGRAHANRSPRGEMGGAEVEAGLDDRFGEGLPRP